MVFPVVMYGYESWTIKKAEHWIDAFELWCCRRLLRSYRSVLGVHWNDWCWGWNSNTLATWCKELTHLKRPWCWERFRAGGKGDNRGWDGWMASPTQWTWVWVDSGSWWWTERPGVLSDWTELKITKNPRSENNNGSRWPCPVVVPNKAISRRKKNWQWLRKIEVGKKSLLSGDQAVNVP